MSVDQDALIPRTEWEDELESLLRYERRENKRLRERMVRLERIVGAADVMLSCCQEWEDEVNVEFVNIEEDIQGRDILTFKCPRCGEQHRSMRCAK